MPNKKNGGVIPAVPDKRIMYVPIGCGNCIECRKQKASNWRTRLQEDIRHNINGKFITLTFSNESIKMLEQRINKDKPTEQRLRGYTLDNAIAILSVKLFRERWRKEYGKSIRHWLVTELGHNGTENIHMHGLIWTNEPIEKVIKHWQYGYVWPRNSQVKTYVNSKTINYIVKYVSKIDTQHKYYKSIVLTSAGIGKGYMDRIDCKRNVFNHDKTIETYTDRSGAKLTLPKYYRNKIYTDEEREALWLYKLDKMKRYVLGIEIDISKDETEYINAVKSARQINKELGYGTSYHSEREKKYEEERRAIIQETRIKNAKTGRQEP